MNIDYVISKIKEKLDKEVDTFQFVGLRRGILGLSLFNFHYSNLYNDASALNDSIKYLKNGIDRLNDENYNSYHLFSELAEVGYYVLWAKKEKLYNESIELVEDLDEILNEALKTALANKNFDPFTGALLYGFYFLARLETKPQVAIYLKEIAEAIYINQVNNTFGVCWPSQIKVSKPAYLGISHGNASIILFLILLEQNGIINNSEALVKCATNFITNQRLKDKPLIYPVIAGENYVSDLFPNHWCYGDPGTLYGLVVSSLHNNNNSELYKQSIKDYSQVITRKLQAPYFPTGNGILYGYSGLAMLYGKLFELTDETIFNKAYQEIINNLIYQLDQNDKDLGYKGYWNQEFPITNLSLNEGIIGIGLTLMAAKNPAIQKSFRYLFYI